MGVGGVVRETCTGDCTRDSASLLVALGLAGLGHRIDRPILLHVRKSDLAQRADTDAIAHFAIAADLHFGPDGECGRMGGVVDYLRNLLQRNLIGITQITWQARPGRRWLSALDGAVRLAHCMAAGSLQRNWL